MGTHEVFSLPVELFDAPDDGVLVREVGDSTDGGLEGWGVDVGRDGDDDIDVVGDGTGFELGFRLVCFL